MKVKIKIPESLNDITLRQYQKYMHFHNESDDMNMQNLKMVEYFCGLKLSDVNQIRLTDFNDILKKLNDAFNQKRRYKIRFELHGKEWGMIPDLEEMSFGEYIDLNTYISDYSTLHNYMAVFYRPITNRKKDMYLIEDYEGSDKYASLMLDAPLDVVLEAQLFFLSFRDRIIERYSSLYEQSGEKRIGANYGEKWGWYSQIYTIARGDRFRFDDVIKLKINDAMTFLEHEKDFIEASK